LHPRLASASDFRATADANVPLAMKPSPVMRHPKTSARALAEAFTPRPTAPAAPPPQGFSRANRESRHHKAKTEIARLELLVKKSKTELQIERQYNQPRTTRDNLTTIE